MWNCITSLKLPIEAENNILTEVQNKRYAHLFEGGYFIKPDKYDKFNNLIKKYINEYNLKIERFSDIKNNIKQHLLNAGITEEKRYVTLDTFLCYNMNKLSLIIYENKYVMKYSNGYDVLFRIS